MTLPDAAIVQQNERLTPVGVMHDYEHMDDCPWHDGLLMDLLADELTA